MPFCAVLLLTSLYAPATFSIFVQLHKDFLEVEEAATLPPGDTLTLAFWEDPWMSVTCSLCD
jgi:hypothetical protein